MLHHPVGHRELRRGVVELDVAGEGRLAREDDRRGEDCESSDCGAQRPQVGRLRLIGPSSSPAIASPAAAAPPARRSCPVSVASSPARMTAPARAGARRPRQPLACGLDQPSAAEREPREDEREDDPGDEQGQRLSHWCDATVFTRRSARFADGSKTSICSSEPGRRRRRRRSVRGVDRDAAARRGHALLVGLSCEILEDIQRVRRRVRADDRVVGAPVADLGSPAAGSGRRRARRPSGSTRRSDRSAGRPSRSGAWPSRRPSAERPGWRRPGRSALRLRRRRVRRAGRIVVLRGRAARRRSPLRGRRDHRADRTLEMTPSRRRRFAHSRQRQGVVRRAQPGAGRRHGRLRHPPRSYNPPTGRLAQLGEHQLDKLGVAVRALVPPTIGKPRSGGVFAFRSGNAVGVEAGAAATDGVWAGLGRGRPRDCRARPPRDARSRSGSTPG